MAAYNGGVINDQILIHSTVYTPDRRKGEVYQALVDTGAQKTLISPGVVQTVGLIPSGPDWITPVNGVPVFCYKYKIRLDIYLPEDTESVFWGKDMYVVELPYQPPNFDVLLGMDFFSRV